MRVFVIARPMDGGAPGAALGKTTPEVATTVHSVGP
jgi:hypothetical protein